MQFERTKFSLLFPKPQGTSNFTLMCPSLGWCFSSKPLQEPREMLPWPQTPLCPDTLAVYIPTIPSPAQHLPSPSFSVFISVFHSLWNSKQGWPLGWSFFYAISSILEKMQVFPLSSILEKMQFSLLAFLPFYQLFDLDP